MPTRASHSITSERRISTLHICGEIDMSNVDEIYAWIHDAIDANNVKTVQIDLAQLGFIDSMGIRCLVDAHNYARVRGTTLTIVNPAPFIAKLLRITGVAELFGLN